MRWRETFAKILSCLLDLTMRITISAFVYCLFYWTWGFDTYCRYLRNVMFVFDAVMTTAALLYIGFIVWNRHFRRVVKGVGR